MASPQSWKSKEQNVNDEQVIGDAVLQKKGAESKR